jgi:hypothetical protein
MLNQPSHWPNPVCARSKGMWWCTKDLDHPGECTPRGPVSVDYAQPNTRREVTQIYTLDDATRALEMLREQGVPGDSPIKCYLAIHGGTPPCLALWGTTDGRPSGGQP